MGEQSDGPRVVKLNEHLAPLTIQHSMMVKFPRRVIVETKPCIAVIGLSAAGKSTLFDILPWALFNEEFEGPRTPQHLSKRKFPPRTEHNENATSYIKDAKRFLINMKSRSGEQFEVKLKIVDPPGEIFKNEQQTRRYADNFTDCTGILIIFSPFDIEHFQEIEESTGWFMDQIGKNSRRNIERRVAFAVSQADTIPWIGRIRPKSAKAWLLGHRGIGGALKAKLHDKRAYFFLSSIGWVNGQSNLVCVDVPKRHKLIETRAESLLRPGKFPDINQLKVPGDQIRPEQWEQHGKRITNQKAVPSQVSEESDTEEAFPDFLEDGPVVEPSADMLGGQFFGFTDPVGVSPLKDNKKLELERGKIHIVPGRPISDKTNTIYYPWNLIVALRHVAGIS